MSLTPGLAGILPIIAAGLAVLLLILFVAALRQLRRPAAASPPAAPALAGPPEPARPAVTLREEAGRIALLSGQARAIEALPLVIVVGATGARIGRLVPGLGADTGELARGMARRPAGDGTILVGPAGAVLGFEDGLLASPAWEARWTGVLGGLMAQRGDRPFDGLVFVLQAGQLAGSSRLSDGELAAIGDRLYRLVWTAQQVGGWRVPITLIVEGCEALAGFAATAACLPEPVRRAPFGWAVPFALDSAFERGWVNQAIGALTSRLGTLQSWLLMRPDAANQAEALLLFPDAIARLDAALQVVLTSLLRPSAYHQAFLFRGFYLVGSAYGAELFAARLFGERIFPEHVLARPAQGALSRRQFRIRVAQAGLAALLLLALVGVRQLLGNRDAVETVHQLVAGIAVLPDQVRASGVAVPPPERVAQAKRLLELMAGVSLPRLETVWAPLSFTTYASQDVEAAIRASYELVVLDAVHGRLSGAIPALLDAADLPEHPTPPGAPAGCRAESGGEADVARLRTLTERLGEYGRQLQAYHDLPLNPGIPGLAVLVEFSLSTQLPATFASDSRLYREGLRGAVPRLLPIGDIRAGVGAIVRTQFDRALAGAYPGSALGRGVAAVAAESGPSDPQPGIARLRRLDAALHVVQAQAALPENGWVAGGDGDATITLALGRIAALAPHGDPGADVSPVAAPLPAALRGEAEHCLARTRAALRQARAFGSVSVLEDGGARLAPLLLAVLTALDGFLAQPVAQSAEPALPTTASSASGGSLFWAPRDLQSLQELTESYVVFAAQALSPDLPEGFRRLVAHAASERLDHLVGDAIARARQRGADRGIAATGGTAALRDEIGRFADAVPVLTNLRAVLREAGETGSAERLSGLLADQAVRLLRRVDALLTTADPYQLVDRSLSFWSGQPPVAAAAFGAENLPDLVGSLPARRDFVEALARDHAAPLVDYLQQSGGIQTAPATALVSRWRGIIAVLDRYHRSDATNSLSRLEQFIAADMDRIDPTNCRQLAGGAGASDWFGEQARRISGAVLARCGGVAYGDAVGQYGELAAAFDRDLAGRFPFAPPNAPDADPGDVRRFFSRYAADLPGLRARVAAIAALARAGATPFLDQLSGVQAAFTAWLADPAPDAALSYDVSVEFRTNSGSDPGANQVAETMLRIGTQSLSSFASGRSLAWSGGQTVQVRLRWAQNAPSLPADDAAAGFDFAGPWALLRLLATQRPPQAALAQLSDRRPEPVAFTVKLRRNPNAAAGGEADLPAARLHMRLGLSATMRVAGQPDRRVPVVLPAFPTAAPQGSAPVVLGGRAAGGPISLLP